MPDWLVVFIMLYIAGSLIYFLFYFMAWDTERTISGSQKNKTHCARMLLWTPLWIFPAGKVLLSALKYLYTDVRRDFIYDLTYKEEDEASK